MARGGKAKPRAKDTARNGSDLCLQCGLCCDGTLFANIVVRIPEREEVEALGLEVREDPAHGLVAPQPCSAFVGGCCALYTVGRPATCDGYLCGVLGAYTAGRRGLDDSLVVIGLVRSLARELEVEMGSTLGEFTLGAVSGYLEEHTPWIEPEHHGRFLVAFHRFSELGKKYFGYDPKPMEVQAAAAGERISAVDAP